MCKTTAQEAMTVKIELGGKIQTESLHSASNKRLSGTEATTMGKENTSHRLLMMKPRASVAEWLSHSTCVLLTGV